MRMLLGEIRPARMLATHAHALALPRMQRARKGRRRRMPQIDLAVEEEPVGREHVKIVVPAVVPATRQVGEEAAGMVEGARIDAELRKHGGVDELDVAQVAVQEGEDGDALLVGEEC